MIVSAICDASQQATTAFLCRNAFRACGLLPRDPHQVLKWRLMTPWTGDPMAEGADPALDDRGRRAKVLHYGSRELT
jgi:hypothetical protein